MLTCTYNGWADAPEDEREALDQYERNAALAEEQARRRARIRARRHRREGWSSHSLPEAA